MRSASTRGVPPTWPYPGARIRGESADVRLGPAGAYDLVLSEVLLPAAGAAAGPLARPGPVGVTVVAGDVWFGGQPVPTEDVVVQSPGDTRAFANAGPGPARLLVLAVTPAGAGPAQLPRTGVPAPLLPLALAATAAGRGGVGLGLRRARDQRAPVSRAPGAPGRRGEATPEGAIATPGRGR